MVQNPSISMTEKGLELVVRENETSVGRWLLGTAVPLAHRFSPADHVDDVVERCRTSRYDPLEISKGDALQSLGEAGERHKELLRYARHGDFTDRFVAPPVEFGSWLFGAQSLGVIPITASVVSELVIEALAGGKLSFYNELRKDPKTAHYIWDLAEKELGTLVIPYLLDIWEAGRNQYVALAERVTLDDAITTLFERNSDQGSRYRSGELVAWPVIPKRGNAVARGARWTRDYLFPIFTDYKPDGGLAALKGDKQVVALGISDHRIISALERARRKHEVYTVLAGVGDMAGKAGGAIPIVGQYGAAAIKSGPAAYLARQTHLLDHGLRSFGGVGRVALEGTTFIPGVGGAVDILTNNFSALVPVLMQAEARHDLLQRYD